MVCLLLGALLGATGMYFLHPDRGAEATAETETITAGAAERTCDDFATQAEAQAYFASRGGTSADDVGGLDPNGDGMACEHLPGRTSAPEPAAETGGSDEDAYRAAFEQVATVDDWAEHLELVRGVCGEDAAAFAESVRLLAENELLPAFEIDVQFVCPERLGEFQTVVATLDDQEAPEPEPEGEPAGLGPGVYVVGTDIQPGTYRSAGGDGRSCYWARLSNLTGEDDIIANDITDGPSVVQILEGDTAFRTSGCLLALEVSTSTVCRSVLTPPGPGGHPSVGGN